MNWEDIIKNQIQVGRQKLRSDNQPLPDDDDDDCYQWLLELKSIVNEPLFKPYNNIFMINRALAEREDMCCELKRILETETSYHHNEDVEFGLNYEEYGNLWDLEVFAYPNNAYKLWFRIDLSFGTIPEKENENYPFAIPWLLTQYIIVLQADADKDTNLQTNKHIILDEWEEEIKKNLDKFDLFFDYIGNINLRHEFYYKLIRDVIEFLYQNQKDKTDDDAVFNRMYHYFMSIITSKL
tara:strand:+ start:970 stop:1686 length:717 start_codon:yes stop_codon:yes gene_type:complete